MYRPNRDYRIDWIGDRVEIRRVETGRIADGALVLVDYLFRLGGSFSLDTVTHDLRVRQDFEFGLSPFYRLRQQNQSITPEDATGVIAEDITGHTIGAEFQRGPIRLLAEYEDHESTINPFNAIRISANYKRRLKSGASGSLKARWSQVDHNPPNERETRLFNIEGRYRHPITEGLTVEGAVLYRTEDDSLSGKDEGIDVDLSLEWFIRQTEVKVTYEYGRFDDEFAENEFSTLWVQVRRRF